MNIGDRVRLLHGKEEGIIVSIKGNIIDIEIEDGFTIPAMKSEIVKIAADESRLTGNKVVNEKESKDKQVVSNTVFAQKGIFVAFSHINDQKLSMHIINNTDFDLPFVISKDFQIYNNSLTSGVLKSKAYLMIDEVNITNFDNWANYVFQFLFTKDGHFELREPLIKKIRFRASNFFKSKQTAPLLNKEAYTFQLDKDEKIMALKVDENEAIHPDKIVEQMFEKTTAEPEKSYAKAITKPSMTVDLHIEELVKDHKKMNNSEKLQYQLNAFEKNLENAIASGMDEITFIHGVGNGVLRTEIHKVVSKHPQVAYYKDAQKEKFGYGATYVKLTP